MKLIKRIKKMVIAQDKDGTYAVFTFEEYSYGKGFRTAEFDGITNLEEAESQAKHY